MGRPGYLVFALIAMVVCDAVALPTEAGALQSVQELIQLDAQAMEGKEKATLSESSSGDGGPSASSSGDDGSSVSLSDSSKSDGSESSDTGPSTVSSGENNGTSSERSSGNEDSSGSGGQGSSAESSTSMDGSDKISAGDDGSGSKSSSTDDSMASSRPKDGPSKGGAGTSSSPPVIISLVAGMALGGMLAKATLAKKKTDMDESADNADKIKEEDDLLRDDADGDSPDEENALENDADKADADQAAADLMDQAADAAQEEENKTDKTMDAEEDYEEQSLRLEAKAAKLAQHMGFHRHRSSDEEDEHYVRRKERTRAGREKAMAAAEESMMAFENDLPDMPRAKHRKVAENADDNDADFEG